MTDSTSPLSSEQHRILREASERARSFQGAARVAAFNGWTVGFFAVVSLLVGFPSLTGLLTAAGLGWVARNELVGRRRILDLEPSGLELLWRNQVGFMALIIAYCLWSMYRTVAFPDPQLAALDEVLGDEGGELVRSLSLTVYALVIGLTVLFQGLNARYYHVRVGRMRRYLEETPPWVVQVQQSAGRAE